MTCLRLALVADTSPTVHLPLSLAYRSAELYRYTEVDTAEAGTANPEERGNDKEAADEEVEPCGSEKWYVCSCMPSM